MTSAISCLSSRRLVVTSFWSWAPFVYLSASSHSTSCALPHYCSTILSSQTAPSSSIRHWSPYSIWKLIEMFRVLWLSRNICSSASKYLWWSVRGRGRWWPSSRLRSVSRKFGISPKSRSEVSCIYPAGVACWSWWGCRGQKITRLARSSSRSPPSLARSVEPSSVLREAAKSAS